MSAKLKKWYVEYKYWDTDHYEYNSVDSVYASSAEDACRIVNDCAKLGTIICVGDVVDCKAYPYHREDR